MPQTSEEMRQNHKNLFTREGLLPLSPIQVRHSFPVAQRNTFEQASTVQFLSVEDRKMRVKARQRMVRDAQLKLALQSLERAQYIKCNSMLDNMRFAFSPLAKARSPPTQVNQSLGPSPSHRNLHSPQSRQLSPVCSRKIFERYKDAGGMGLADELGDKGSSYSKRYPRVITYADL